ncbi:phage baseplate assembly protein [Escherichia marmotae]|uniref:phage baseplate assembly protein domain-containing protein n=1 Tax=Escherichia TaxID=561 RepID=UPI0007A04E43|nr:MULTISPECIES: phage baseplate assembly protein [Escherichia]EFA4129618.1 phage baseplate assembly protein [Escherichia coli O13]EEQ6524444.1 phage baseplate assembly protein [Escherichia coli]EEQ9687090.1 phage baseplate assembly protein [Escherichia coli]EEQ9773688.1 phage baseplate assembly protein [Escherichia coli]EFC9932390.1 phage baseplate assembly protein [Escherichia coli]
MNPVQVLFRRLVSLLSVGRVTAGDDSGVVQTVQVQSPSEVRSDTPVLQQFGFSSVLPAGTDVVVMSLAGNRSSAVVVASGHQSYRINGLNSGEVVVYNQWGQYVRLGEDGIVVEASGQQVLVNSATTLEVTATDGVTLKTPSLKVTGDITDNCESNSTTLKALREAYNDHTHPVSGVESGGSTVTSQATTETV